MAAAPPNVDARRKPFGLDADESAVFADAFEALAAPLGLDGRRIAAALARGDAMWQALQLPPGFTELLYGRAHSLFGAGHQGRAEPLFRTLCVIDAAVADYWVGYGLCLRCRDARAEAALAFATAATLRPDWAVPHFHAAQLALAEDRWGTAVEHLDAFRERDADDVPDGMRREARRQARALAFRADHRGADAGDEGPRR